MKKAVLVFALMVAGSMALTAQASGTAAQRLVGGTWTAVNGLGTLVFNADGTMTDESSFGRGYVHWAAIDDTIVMMPSGSSWGSSYQFRVSADGRTLILSRETSNRTEGWIFRRN